MDERPALQRKHTKSTKAKQVSALDSGLALTIEGERFSVRVGDVTPFLAGELRRGIGMSFRRLMDELTVDPDIDLLSAWVWLARRIGGESVAMGEVQVTYAQMFADGFDLAPAEPEGVDLSDPEA